MDKPDRETMKNYGKKYKATGGHNGDAIGAALKEAGVSLDEVARANGLSDRLTGTNPGMIRMNLGNMLRGLQRNGKEVTIGATKIAGWNADEQAAYKASRAKPKAEQAAA